LSLLITFLVVFPDLDRKHPESYHSFMWNNFFKHIDIDPENAHLLDGNAPDPVIECDAFEAKITEAGGIELFIGGRWGWDKCINLKFSSSLSG